MILLAAFILTPFILYRFIKDHFAFTDAFSASFMIFLDILLMVVRDTKEVSKYDALLSIAGFCLFGFLLWIILRWWKGTLIVLSMINLGAFIFTVILVTPVAGRYYGLNSNISNLIMAGLILAGSLSNIFFHKKALKERDIAIGQKKWIKKHYRKG